MNHELTLERMLLDPQVTKSIQQMAAQVGGFQGKTSAAGAQPEVRFLHFKVSNGIGDLTKQLQSLQAWLRELTLDLLFIQKESGMSVIQLKEGVSGGTRSEGARPGRPGGCMHPAGFAAGRRGGQRFGGRHRWHRRLGG